METGIDLYWAWDFSRTSSEYKNKNTNIFRSIPFGSPFFFIFVNDLCFSLILCFQIVLAEMSISDSRVYPRHESGQKAHLAPQWEEQMRS